MPETEDINSSMGVWAIRGLPAMPLKLRLLVLTVCVMCLIVLTLSFVVKIPEIRKLRGQIIAKGSVADIVAPSRGKVSNIYVRAGDYVERNDPLFRVDESITHFALGDTLESKLAKLTVQLQRAKDELKQNADQQVALETSHVAKLRYMSDQLSLQKEIVKWLYEDVKVHTEQLERVSNLTNSGLATQQSKEQAQLTLNASQQHLLNAKAQVVSYGRQKTDAEENFERTKVQFSLEATRLTSEIDQIRLKISDVKKSNIVTVLAPISGWVTKVMVNEGASVGITAKKLIQISANTVDIDEFEMEFYSSSRELEGLTVGQSARVAMDTFGVNEWGTANLELRDISKSAFKPQELSFGGNLSQPVFVLTTKLSDKTFLNGKTASELRVGMTGTGYFVASERRLISWIIDPIREFIRIVFRMQDNWST